jgi:hypothetical protein
MRIRIQIQDFDDPMLKKFTEKNGTFFLFSGHLKDSQATREASSHPKKTSDTSKREISRLFFTYFLVIVALKDMDPIRIKIRI